MFKLVINFTIIFIFVIIFSTVVRADIFTYTVDVSETADTTQQAKTNALANSRLKSLNIVVRKIISISSFDKLESIFNNKNSYLFTRGLKVNSETIENKTYGANLTYTFNKEAIYKALEENGIKYIKNKEDSYLVIPIYIIDDKESEDSHNNPWSSYWFNVKEGNFLSHFIYYKPPQDSQFLTNKAYLEELKINLSIKDVYLIKLYLSDDVYTLNIYSYNNDKTTIVKDIVSLEDAISQASSIMEESSTNAIIDRLTAKRLNENITVHYTSFSKWLEIKKTIANIVGNYTVLEIGSAYIKINIQYPNNIETLKKSFLKNCLFLNEDTLTLQTIKEC